MKRMLTFLLVLAMVLGAVPVTGYAAEPDAAFVPTNRGISEVEYALFPMVAMGGESAMEFAMADIAEGESYETMSTSQNMIDMIKDFEGFSATPYADNTQWTVGYGSYCGNYPADPKPDIKLTEPEAEARLKQDLTKTYEPIVNDFCERIGKQPTQQQFDALLDFTYNAGGGWTSGSKLSGWIENPTTEMDLVNAFGAWCRVGTELNYTLSCRRIREALVFIHGEYYRAYGSPYFESDVKVLDNDDLPRYKFTIYRANGGTFSNGKNYCINYYKVGTRYGEFPAVSNGSENLRGWQITVVNDVRQETYEVVGPVSIVKNNLQVRASWGAGSLPEPKPLPFTDVPEGSWFYDAVKYVYDNGMMNGISNKEFDPSGNMTRGMLVTVLHRMDGSPAVANSQRSTFTDIQGAYYTDAIDWAYHSGIVNGVDETTFAPNRIVTRQEAVTIFYRYCVQYLKLSAGDPGELTGFEDIQSVVPYAADAFAWAVSTGLVEGSAEADGLYLNPGDTLNRAQAAVLLMRCAEEIL